MHKAVSLQTTVSSRKICVFCLGRLSTLPQPNVVARRHLTSSSQCHKPGENLATQESTDSDYAEQQDTRQSHRQQSAAANGRPWIEKTWYGPFRAKRSQNSDRGGSFSQNVRGYPHDPRRGDKLENDERRSSDAPLVSYKTFARGPWRKRESYDRESKYQDGSEEVRRKNWSNNATPRTTQRLQKEPQHEFRINKVDNEASQSVRSAQFDPPWAAGSYESERNFADAERSGSRSLRDRKSRRVNEFENHSAPDLSNPRSRSRQSDRARNRAFTQKDVTEEPDDDRIDQRRERKKQRKQERELQKQERVTPVHIPPFISVANLATVLKVRMEDFTMKLEDLGFEDIAPDHVLNHENASLVAMEYNHEPIVDSDESEDLQALPPAEDPFTLPPRPPVITIMGHVDHGKTTILDYLRESSVAASEHGGITQHIGAFSVPMASGKLITFLDTPGHAAFLSMRQRGANVTDIVVLVVAADDSVKPQTIEAIKHAKAARVPIIVAINKVDKEEADVDKVKRDLTRHEIVVEDYGGDIQSVEVSGKTGQGIDSLEEALALQAEVLDMRAAVDGPVEGWVLEATTKKAGRVATVLVRRGSLRVGDVIVAGTTWARVRTLKNAAGADVEEATPGTPVEVDGWRDQPTAGDEVLQASDEQHATSVTEYRETVEERTQATKDMEVINEARRLEAERRAREKAEKEDAAAAAATSSKPTPAATPPTTPSAPSTEAKPNELFLLIKADVWGSAEAVSSSILSLPLANQPVSLTVLRTGVGPITESDVDQLAVAPRGAAVIVSFNQPVHASIAAQAAAAGVDILDANIIYDVIDRARALVEARLPPIVSARVTGEAECAAVFEIGLGGRKTARVAGCKVRNGMLEKGKRVKVFRGEGEAAVVYDGTVASLKSHKKDVQEIRKGSECGLSFDGWEGFEVGDMLQCYEETREKRRLM